MNFRRSIIIEKNSKRLNLIAKINAFVDLLAGLKGVRMSRDVKTIEKMFFWSGQKTLSVFVSSIAELLNYVTLLTLDIYLVLLQNLIQDSNSVYPNNLY
ncbi:MAG: GTP cyclohydrolase, FolE2/MptA family [Candidatus Njordarchaeia archaeon]